MGSKASIFRFADMEVREREFCLVKAGEVLPVEPKTFRVLLFLLRNPQKLIAKEELLNAVWGDAAVTDSSLTRTIAQQRGVAEFVPKDTTPSNPPRGSILRDKLSYTRTLTSTGSHN